MAYAKAGKGTQWFRMTENEFTDQSFDPRNLEIKPSSSFKAEKANGMPRVDTNISPWVLPLVMIDFDPFGTRSGWSQNGHLDLVAIDDGLENLLHRLELNRVKQGSYLLPQPLI